MRKKLALTGAAVAVVLLSSLVLLAASDVPATATHTTAIARLVRYDGVASGTVRFTQLPGRVRLNVRAFNVGQDFHGFHVHEVGDCSGTPPFANAGGHLNLDGYPHGSHHGDLPVLYFLRQVGVDAVMYTNGFTVNQLFDGNGSAVIVHEKPDNYANIPPRYTASGATAPGPDAATSASGDSGSRILCGAVKRS